MLLFGHRFIESKRFYHIFDIEDIIHTPPSSYLYVDFSKENIDIITYLQENDLSFAVNVQNITELIYANAFGANFITVQKNFAKTAQNIAENYLFDAKVLVHIESEKQIEEFAILGVDGVIFAEAIIKIS